MRPAVPTSPLLLPYDLPGLVRELTCISCCPRAGYIVYHAVTSGYANCTTLWMSLPQSAVRACWGLRDCMQAVRSIITCLRSTAGLGHLQHKPCYIAAKSVMCMWVILQTTGLLMYSQCGKWLAIARCRCFLQGCVWFAWMPQGTGRWYPAVMQQPASPVRSSCSSINCLVQSVGLQSRVSATSSSSKHLSDQLSLLIAANSRRLGASSLRPNACCWAVPVVHLRGSQLPISIPPQAGCIL